MHGLRTRTPARLLLLLEGRRIERPAALDALHLLPAAVAHGAGPKRARAPLLDALALLVAPRDAALPADALPVRVRGGERRPCRGVSGRSGGGGGGGGHGGRGVRTCELGLLRGRAGDGRREDVRLELAVRVRVCGVGGGARARGEVLGARRVGGVGLRRARGVHVQEVLLRGRGLGARAAGGGAVGVRRGRGRGGEGGAVFVGGGLEEHLVDGHGGVGAGGRARARGGGAPRAGVVRVVLVVPVRGQDHAGLRLVRLRAVDDALLLLLRGRRGRGRVGVLRGVRVRVVVLVRVRKRMCLAE